MIGMLKRWVQQQARSVLEPTVAVPDPVRHSAPQIMIYKIGNGYLIYKQASNQYREDQPDVVYCPTPLDVARQIVNSEALAKMGIASEPEVLKTTGITAGSFVTKI